MNRARIAVPAALGALLAPCLAVTSSLLADQVTVFPSKDNTIFSEGELSNGQGAIFVGRTAAITKTMRRGLIAFDISSAIPAGSTIEDVVLTLTATRNQFGGNAYLHRLIADWGEGTSNSGDSGSGTLATEGDATWQNRFFSLANPTPWNTAGGDFVSAISSQIFVPANLLFETPFPFPSTPVMVQDVQRWLDFGDNYGWLIQGDEVLAEATRFDSDEAFFPDNRPTLTIQFSAPSPQWNVDADGSWGVADNWSTKSPPDSPTAVANLLGKITAPRTVALDGNRTVGSLNFDNAQKYTIAPGSPSSSTLTIGGAAAPSAITLNAATHEISANVTLAAPTTITVPADGKLILSGALQLQSNQLKLEGGGDVVIGANQSKRGALLTVQNAHLALNGDAGAPPTALDAPEATLGLAISGESPEDDSLVTLNASQHLYALAVDYLDDGKQGLDLNSTQAGFHSVRTYFWFNPDTKADLAAAINYGKIHPGEGIFDAGMALHPGSAIGIAVATDRFGNSPLLIRTTRVGDLNLDGCVTISDFIDLASHFNSSGFWDQGDMNGDGIISISDFIDLASNFNSCFDGTELSATPAEQQMLAAFAAEHGVSVVPEPGSFSALLGAASLLRRRRRR
jgi:hypothetical protein